MGLICVFYNYAFGIAMDTHGMCDLAQSSSPMTWISYFLLRHGSMILKRIQGLNNYNVHSLMQEKIPRQLRGQGGMAYLIKREIEKYVLTVKQEHECYKWLKIETPNDIPTFVVGSYICHQDSNFYACLIKDLMKALRFQLLCKTL